MVCQCWPSGRLRICFWAWEASQYLENRIILNIKLFQCMPQWCQLPISRFSTNNYTYPTCTGVWHCCHLFPTFMYLSMCIPPFRARWRIVKALGMLAAMGWWCLVANLAFSRFSPVEETMKGWKNHMFHRTGRNETSWNINVCQHVPMNTAWSQKMGSGKSRIQSWTAGKPGMWPFVMIQACAKGVPVRNLVQRRSSKLWWACNE